MVVYVLSHLKLRVVVLLSLKAKIFFLGARISANLANIPFQDCTSAYLQRTGCLAKYDMTWKHCIFDELITRRLPVDEYNPSIVGIPQKNSNNLWCEVHWSIYWMKVHQLLIPWNRRGPNHKDGFFTFPSGVFQSNPFPYQMCVPKQVVGVKLSDHTNWRRQEMK